MSNTGFPSTPIDLLIELVFFRGSCRPACHQHRHPRHMQPEKLLFMLPSRARVASTISLPLSLSSPHLRQAQAFSRSGRSVRYSLLPCLVPLAAWKTPPNYNTAIKKHRQSNQQPKHPHPIYFPTITKPNCLAFSPKANPPHAE